MKNYRRVEISFRDVYPALSTTYASHGMYYYPARFIPQVVRFFIEKYTKEGDWLLDPFAGSGTVGVEALITNRNALCLDLNPIIEPLLEAKTYLPKSPPDISQYRQLNNAPIFKPKWSRIEEWYPPEFLEVLEKLWGIYYENPHPLTLIALFKTSRRFSLADDQVPKIFRSKKKRIEIEKMLKSENPYKLILDFFEKSVRNVYKASAEFKTYYKGGTCIARGHIDIVNYKLDREVNHLITSPPYGMAHEYIRSFKLELAWLGYDDKQIRKLSKLEIPYRHEKTIPPIEIHSKTYERYYNIIEKKNPKLVRVYEKYFTSVLGVFERLGSRITDYLAIFVGNASFSGIDPPYDIIFTEHLEEEGFEHVITYVDVIKSRKLFRNRKNASPSGIETEHLVVLKAKR
ncbi:DNA methyltransferase [Pyrococcus kukulkanii]|uniref:DNA methyltransferase n=1 Tax=Pyrococcus kukulkanii TaxID=1609559 RepID=UPI00356B5DCC